jgi:hypothetical protein
VNGTAARHLPNAWTNVAQTLGTGVINTQCDNETT